VGEEAGVLNGDEGVEGCGRLIDDRGHIDDVPAAALQVVLSGGNGGLDFSYLVKRDGFVRGGEVSAGFLHACVLDHKVSLVGGVGDDPDNDVVQD